MTALERWGFTRTGDLSSVRESEWTLIEQWGGETVTWVVETLPGDYFERPADEVSIIVYSVQEFKPSRVRRAMQCSGWRYVQDGGRIDMRGFRTNNRECRKRYIVDAMRGYGYCDIREEMTAHTPRELATYLSSVAERYGH